MVAATEPVPEPNSSSPTPKEEITSASTAPEKAPVKPEPAPSTLTPTAQDDREDGEIDDSDDPDVRNFCLLQCRGIVRLCQVCRMKAETRTLRSRLSNIRPRVRLYRVSIAFARLADDSHTQLLTMRAYSLTKAAGFRVGSGTTTAACAALTVAISTVQTTSPSAIPVRPYPFTHSPNISTDSLHIRTDSKNVCLYFLLGTCKFGPTKCAYSHRRDWLPAGWWDTEEGVAGEIKRIDDSRREAKDARRAAAAADKEARAQRKREQTHLNNLLSNLTNGAPAHPVVNTVGASTSVAPVGNGINGHQQNGVSVGAGVGVGVSAGPSARRRNPPNLNSNSQPRKPRPVQQQQQHQPVPPPQPGLFPAQFHAPMQPSMSLQELAERMQQLHLLQREQQAQAQRHGFTERQVLDLAAYGIKPWDEGALVRWFGFG